MTRFNIKDNNGFKVGVATNDGSADREVNIEDLITAINAQLQLVPKPQIVLDFEAINGLIPEDGSVYVDALAIGDNASAKIYSDGTVIGSTDNGSYTRWANGELEIKDISVTKKTTTIAVANVYFSTGSTFTYPIVATELEVSPFNDNGGTVEYSWIGGTRDKTLSEVTIYGAGANSTARVLMGYTAKGRWK